MWRRGAVGFRVLAAAAFAVHWCACVTTVTDQPSGVAPAPQAIDLEPIVLPLAGAVSTTTPVHGYYVSVLGQMQEALQERDLERLQGLLATHARPRAPRWAREQMAQFGGAALGLEFELHAASHSRIELADGGAVALGSPLEFALVVESPPGRRVRPIGGSGLRFLVTLSMTDHDGLGGTAQRTSSLVLEPEPEQGGSPWRVPFNAAVPAGNSVLRETETTVELLPGVIEVDGREASVRRLLLARQRRTLYPAGHEPIREKPLQTLRNAIALGDPQHFAHQYLAAHFVPEGERAAAVALLMPVVRLGSAEQARAAMACLAVLTGVDLPVVDREAWLEWWRTR